MKKTLNKHKIHLIAFSYLAILILTLYSAFLPVQTPVVKAAFGISPPWVKNDYLLPGSSFSQTIYLSTNNPAEDMIVKYVINGDRDIKKWITIEDADNLIMKKGQAQFPLVVKVEVPKRAGLGQYKGNLDIRLEPLVKNNTGGVAIALGANADIRLKVVGDEIINYKVSNAKIASIKEGENLTFDLQVENLGNVSLTELKTQVDIWSQNEKTLIKNFETVAISEPVDAYANKMVRVTIENPELEAGQYWAKVRAYKNDIAIFEIKSFLVIEPVFAASPEETMTTEATMESVAQEAALVTEESVALKAAAPEVIMTSDSSSKWFLIFGIAGIAFGFVALIALVVVATILIRRMPKLPPQQ